MSGAFRCKCGRWIRADDAVARCPNCLRTLGRSPVGWVGWVVGGGAAALAAGLLVAAVWPRTPPASAVTVEPAPAPAGRPPPATPPAEPSRPPASNPPAATARTPAPEPPPAPPLPPPSRPAPPAPEPPRVGRLEVEPAGKYKEGDTFVQTVTVARSSAFGALGVVTTQAAEYTLTSKLEVTRVNADGSMVVTQAVLAAKLLDATADLKEPLADALTKAVGATFVLTVGPTGTVTGLKGLDDPLNVKLGRAAEQQTLRLWSVLDADAWKELGGFTFFQPDKPGVAARWARDFGHDWGPLGSWVGRTDYLTAPKAEKDGRHRIDYAHALSHRPAKGGGNLPFAVKESAFPYVKAGGVIRYDPAAHRVSAAEEVFHVRGAVGVSFGGADAAVQVEEVQKFRLTASEVTPRELVGRGPTK